MKDILDHQNPKKKLVSIQDETWKQIGILVLTKSVIHLKQLLTPPFDFNYQQAKAILYHLGGYMGIELAPTGESIKINRSLITESAIGDFGVNQNTSVAESKSSSILRIIEAIESAPSNAASGTILEARIERRDINSPTIDPDSFLSVRLCFNNSGTIEKRIPKAKFLQFENKLIELGSIELSSFIKTYQFRRDDKDAILQLLKDRGHVVTKTSILAKNLKAG